MQDGLSLIISHAELRMRQTPATETRLFPYGININIQGEYNNLWVYRSTSRKFVILLPSLVYRYELPFTMGSIKLNPCANVIRVILVIINIFFVVSGELAN